MPGHCSRVDYYYQSNPSSSWIEETHKRMFEKSKIPSIELEWNPFPFEEDFFGSRKKWLCERESSRWISDFNLNVKKAMDKEPFTFTDRIAMEMGTGPFHKTIHRLRSTTRGCGDSFAVQRIVEKAQFHRDEFVHDLADRMAAMEMSVEKLMEKKAKKDTKHAKAKALPCACTVKKSFKKEWKGENGVKAKLSYKYQESKKKLTDPITIIIPGAREGEFKTIRAEKYTVINGTKPSDAKIKVIPLEDGDGSSSSSSSSNNSHTDDDEASKKIQGVFAKRRAAAAAQLGWKGKKKDLSPQDAAVIIQTCFREYLVRRSQNLRSLRDLAVAKAKLKELRSLFTNYAYRRHLCRDAEEKQRFSEKTIVLLLTVDSIEGSNHLVKESRRSMIQELESMLDAVDPQSPNRRKFDLPESAPPQKEMETEVAQVVNVVEEENVGSLFA